MGFELIISCKLFKPLIIRLFLMACPINESNFHILERKKKDIICKIKHINIPFKMLLLFFSFLFHLIFGLNIQNASHHPKKIKLQNSYALLYLYHHSFHYLGCVCLGLFWQIITFFAHKNQFSYIWINF